MTVIERPRNRGKTTILLHYMVINPLTIYVVRTEKQAKLAFQLSQKLELNLNESRFISMVDVSLIKHYEHGYKILIDDLDVIIAQHDAKNGFNLVKFASVITITQGKR